jgi:hypothetical protein
VSHLFRGEGTVDSLTVVADRAFPVIFARDVTASAAF